MNRLDDDDRPLSPEEMLRLIEEQQSATSRRLGGDPLLTYTPWGIAWGVGFGALFLHYAYGLVPRGVALSVLFSLMVLAMAVSSFAQRSMSSQVRGEAAERGMMYGFAWLFGFAGMFALGVRLSPLLPVEETGLLWAVMSMTIVAALYIAGGAVWRVRTMFFLGAGLAVLNVVGAIAGPGVHALLMSVGAGGAFIVVGVVQRIRRRGGA
ncbi:hypothetical protein [Streptosporangium carneum]|uniref:Uncharacterized protein n=1 Tax=Streptosporangium carneum TaxID=47481 RepID=A0A9W6HYU9_9ACTN|nr:hypothetical protein [Streptosporangium carneum]GLK08882.1 hypothetical protein GCM10017600_22870 [Streptosporangium carneum]